MRLLLSLILGTPAFLFLLGCSPSGPATHSVKGKVSFDGTDVKEGLIYFDNTDKSLPSYNAIITDGSYTTSVVAGKYSVRITAMKITPFPAGKVGASGEKEGPQQYLPAKFNEKTTLSAEVSAAPKELDFLLTSK